MTLFHPSVFEAVKEQTDCVALAQNWGYLLTVAAWFVAPIPRTRTFTPAARYTTMVLSVSPGAPRERHRPGDVAPQLRPCDGCQVAGQARRHTLAQERRRTGIRENQNRQLELERRVQYWAKNLRPEHAEYLTGRGLTEQFVREYGIGYCSIKVLADAETARALGLLIDVDGKRSWYVPHNRLTIPIFQYGKPVQVAFHMPGGKPKYMYPKDTPKPLAKSFRNGEIPFLVEGPFDYLSLLQVGLPAMLSFGTQLSEAQKEQLRLVKNFTIAFDADEAGLSAAHSLAMEFFPAARIIDLPEGRDVNDLLRELGPDKFKDFMVQAAGQAKDALDMSLARPERSPTISLPGKTSCL